MDNADILLGCGGLMIALIVVVLRKRRTRQRRQFRIRPLNLNRRSQSQFVYFQRMKESDEKQFFKYTRMSVNQFDSLLEKGTPIIGKRGISLGIIPELAITLQ